MCREQSKVNDDRQIPKLATVLLYISMCLFIFQNKTILYLNRCFIHNQSPKSVSCCLHISCYWVILWIMLCLLFNPQTFRLNHWLTFHTARFLLISGKISVLSHNTEKNWIFIQTVHVQVQHAGLKIRSHCAWRNAQGKKDKYKDALIKVELLPLPPTSLAPRAITVMRTSHLFPNT